MLNYKPHIPATVGDVLDQLGFMFVKSPTFEDSFFVGRNIDTVFMQLNEGLKNIKETLGDERYATLVALSARMRAHFEADPGDSNGEAVEGRKLVREMESIVVDAVARLPVLSRDDLVALARRMDTADGTEAELDAAMDQLEDALPNGDILTLLFQNNPELTAEEAVDEALRREAEWREKNN